MTVATNIKLDESVSAGGARPEQFYREMISLLKTNLLRLTEKGPTVPAFASVYGMNILLLGSCYRFLGQFGEAIQAYTLGISITPTNAGFYSLRGILSYDSPDSISDFQNAVQFQFSSIWPSFFLAHHALMTNKIEQCLNWCELALSKIGPNAAKSELENWRAIAQAELNLSPDLVKGSFESAIQFDPTNEIARRNLAGFEKSLNTSGPRPRSVWERESEANVSRFAEVTTRLPSEFASFALAA